MRLKACHSPGNFHSGSISSDSTCHPCRGLYNYFIDWELIGGQFWQPRMHTLPPRVNNTLTSSQLTQSTGRAHGDEFSILGTCPSPQGQSVLKGFTCHTSPRFSHSLLIGSFLKAENNGVLWQSQNSGQKLCPGHLTEWKISIVIMPRAKAISGGRLWAFLLGTWIVALSVAWYWGFSHVKVARH